MIRKRRSSPKTDACAGRIKAMIVAGTLDGRLPPLKDLASTLGFSLMTVWKAMRILVDQGLVQGAPGRGYELIEGESSPAGAGQGGMRVKPALDLLLENDVLSGVFPSGKALPSLKTLGSRYQAHPQTIRKALRRISATGLLVAQGRSYRPGIHGSEKGRSRIVLLMPGNREMAPLLGYLADENLHLFESECARLRVTLEMAVFDPNEENLRIVNVGTGNEVDFAGDDLMGIVYLLTSGQGSDSRVFGFLGHLERPVVLLDGMGIDTLPGILLHNPELRIMPLASIAEASTSVGRFLIGLGHRKIAYFSPYHGAHYSQKNLRSLQSIFAAASRETGVEPFVLTAETHGDFLLTVPRTASLQPVMRAYQAWKRKAPVPFARCLDPFAATYEKRNSLPNLHLNAEIHRRFGPLFKKALADRAISAWVMVNDASAVMALDYLDSCKVSVPRDLSVVSLDDTPEVMLRRITAYNSNITALAHRAISFILYPGAPVAALRRRRIASEGMIVERRTTAKAKQ